ncbi:hypothetical protein AAMO2058_000434500 [Amorphochlora amoebiformis]
MGSTGRVVLAVLAALQPVCARTGSNTFRFNSSTSNHGASLSKHHHWGPERIKYLVDMQQACPMVRSFGADAKSGFDCTRTVLGGGPRKVEGKLGLMFMLADSLPFAPLWNELINNANKNHFRAAVHFSDPNPTTSNIKFTYDRVPHAPSKWCDVLPVVINLFKTMLKDKAVTGGVFVTQTHIPLKTLVHMRQTLLSNDRSIYVPSTTNDSAKFYAVETFSYTRREDMETLVEDYSGGGFDKMFSNPILKETLWWEMCPGEGYPFHALLKYQDLNPHIELSRIPLRVYWSDDGLEAGEFEFPKQKRLAHPLIFTHMHGTTFRKLRESCSLFVRKATPQSTVDGQPIMQVLARELLGRQRASMPGHETISSRPERVRNT